MINSVIVRYTVTDSSVHTKYLYKQPLQSVSFCWWTFFFKKTVKFYHKTAIFESVVIIREEQFARKSLSFYVNRETLCEGIDNSIINYT